MRRRVGGKDAGAGAAADCRPLLLRRLAQDGGRLGGAAGDQVRSKGQAETRTESPTPSQQEFAGSKPSAQAEGSGQKTKDDTDHRPPDQVGVTVTRPSEDGAAVPVPDWQA
jgi:hypothetical protein